MENVEEDEDGLVVEEVVLWLSEKFVGFEVSSRVQKGIIFVDDNGFGYCWYLMFIGDIRGSIFWGIRQFIVVC